MHHWITALRLRTLPLAFSSIGMGAFLAVFHSGFKLNVFTLALLTSLCLQILSNLANDYGDSVHGADNADRVGPSRAVQSGSISPKKMKLAIGVAALLSLTSGLSLIAISEVSFQVFLIFGGFGLLAILAAVLYTNGRLPYGYIGLGDISVYFFFGLLGGIGTYYLMLRSFSWDLLLPASACGLFTVGVLNINNIRDIESDLLAGKKSIPGRLGHSKAIYYHWTLLFLGILCPIIFVLINFQSPKQFLFLLVLPLLIKNALAIKNLEPSKLDPWLKQLAITTLAFVLFFGIGLIL